MNKHEKSYQAGLVEEEKFARLYPEVVPQSSFAVLDFSYKGEEIMIELKSRAVRRSQYPTTMVDINKYTEVLNRFLGNSKLRYCLFVFKFIDSEKYWYYKLDKTECYKLLSAVPNPGLLRECITTKRKIFNKSEFRAVELALADIIDDGMTSMFTTLTFCDKINRSTEYKLQLSFRTDMLTELTTLQATEEGK